KKVYLQPFMLVAGNHAHLDMASNDPDSWKSKLQSNDIEVVPELRGLGEYKEIQQMFINKLNQTIKRR
ncbi:sirohydrochlorin cobaltochelatase, partial [Lactobacillus sp. XV13L]|nr:sirohydrochlorin cobaltochelatase [Lactobacillus sp. XV13L]